MRTRRHLGTVPLTLFQPDRGDHPFTWTHLDGTLLAEPSRVNYFTVVWVRHGQGTFHADLAGHGFSGPTLLFFNPYQTCFLAPQSPLEGAVLRFHANFFCIETHQAEVGCNGVLFNDSYGDPQVRLDPESAAQVAAIMAQMEEEFRTAGLAHHELLVSLLKILLIKASRLKLEQQVSGDTMDALARRPDSLVRLLELVELHYRTHHGPADYASLLSMTPKALGKIVRKHLGRTLTEVIRDRILKHAKWQLLHTLRPVKEIAAEVGFADELYFSRLFRTSTGSSPTSFRKYETAVRGGRNLSM